MADKLPIGTRIQFVKQLDCEATGDHPALTYANKNQLGSIVSYDASEGYLVKTDYWPNPFGATIDEEFVEYFEPMHLLEEQYGWSNRCDTFDTYSKTIEELDYRIHVSKHINSKTWTCTLSDTEGSDEITINYNATYGWVVNLEKLLLDAK